MNCLEVTSQNLPEDANSLLIVIMNEVKNLVLHLDVGECCTSNRIPHHEILHFVHYDKAYFDLLPMV